MNLQSAVEVESDFLEKVPAPCVVQYLETGSLVGNRAFWELFGVDPATSPKPTITDLTHPEDVLLTTSYLRDLAAGKIDKTSIVKRYVRSDGTVFRAQLTATPLKGESGEVARLIGVITPLELQVHSQERTTEAFVASVGHELRSPLHSIVGLAELLADTTRLSQADRELALAILDQANSLNRLVDDLIDLSQMYGEQLQLDRAEISPRELVSMVAEMQTGAAAATGAKLKVAVAANTPQRIVTDGLRIQQILTNLVSNAIRYGEGGAIEIAVDQADSDWLRFSVTDNGPGIEPDFLPELFEPFNKGHSRRVGTGLGLAISKRLIKALGGSISVDSVVGSGSSFTILVPMSGEASATTAAVIPVKQESPLNRVGGSYQHRILVVEDGQVNQMLAKAQLAKLGYIGTIAETGEQGLAMIEEARAAGKPFKAVLMDWHLPGIDGLETTSGQRTAERGRPDEPRLPIIGLTANAMHGDREKCIEAGMDEFLAKPVGLSRLGDVLQALICPIRVDNDPPMLDEAVLLTLSKELGTDTAVEGLLRSFLEELPSRLEPIQAAGKHEPVERKDLHRAVHSLKSTCALIGASQVTAACVVLEQALFKFKDSELSPAGRNCFRSTSMLTIRLSAELKARLD